NPSQILISLTPPADGAHAEDFAGDTRRAAAWFSAEQAVLLAAVEQAATHRYDAHAWQLAWAVNDHLHRRGLWQDQEAVHLAAMEAALRLGDPVAQAHAHRGLAAATTDLGRLEEGRVHAERSIELLTDSGDRGACAESYNYLAYVAGRQGDLEDALGAVQRSLAIYRADDDSGGDDSRRRTAVAATLNGVGWFHTRLGQHQQALDHCQQALALQQELGDDSSAADTWDSIGLALHHLGRYDEAVTSFRNALDLYQQTGGPPWYTAAALGRLGDTYLSAGQPDAARAAWTEGLDILEQLSHADAEPLRVRLRRLDEPSGPSKAERRGADS
ncbi:tetratricopeptide repeat protein, partial [Streptomyces sp. NPDC013172]|uniref:tetratricopeptide repeat protein n=1 Tax=unclassified Streptomyces TaxID=2593676 RepID=UPI0033E220A4